MGALWQRFNELTALSNVEGWWRGFAPRAGEELLTWSWHMAALVVLVWLATMLLRRTHARVRGALWLAALLLIPLLPIMVRLSPLPSTSVAELASRVRPAEAPAPPAAEPTLPDAATAASVGPVSLAAATAASVEPVSAAAEAASAAVPEPTVAAHSEAEARAPAFWREGRFWIGSAVLAWALIAVARLARVLASLLWVRKLARSAGAVADARLAQAFATACAQIGVSRRVELLSSDLISVPVTIGMLRPAVIVPRDLAASGKQGALDHVLYHELAHVRRRDAAVTLYRRVLEAVLFFHPFLWLASRRYEVEQEHICDDWAVAALGDRGGYARALSELAEQARHAAPVAALGFAHRPSLIRVRVTRVLEETGMPQPRLSRLGLLTVAAVSLLVLALTTSLPLFPEATEVLAAEGQAPAPAPSRLPSTHDITGTVWENWADFSQETLAKLDQAASTAKSMEESDRLLGTLGGRRPAPNVVVTLRGESVTREAVTDAEGKFTFTGLLGGDYELSAEMPAPPSWAGVKRQATATERITLEKDASVTLEVRADLVAVRGRITDVDGRPVAGAKVTTVFDEPVDESGQYIDSGDAQKLHDRWVFSHTRLTLSSPDGSYELQGLEPTALYGIARYLGTASPWALAYFSVRVEADGFVQRKSNVPRVPLVTEELLDPARALLKVLVRLETQLKGSPPEIRERGDVPLPSSRGDTITGIDIVLDPIPEKAPAPAVTVGAQPPSAATGTEMVLKHDDGTMEGKRSLGASGHFVQFQCPGPGKWYLTEVQVFGSRYGSPEPPEDTFTITLCDSEFRTVKSIKQPYSIFQRGEERWYKVPVPPLELPEMKDSGIRLSHAFYSIAPFWVNVAFSPSNTKGVYVGYDTSDAECFSKVGLPDQTPGPTPDNGDWMIRLVVTQNPPKQVGPELGAWVEPPKPARSWQEEGLVELRNDDGKSDGKLSMGGTGPAVRFEGVPEGATLTRLRMYASRYGSGFDPETTFADYYVFDDEKRILQTGRIPYSLFSYEEKWVDIPLEPVKVPSAFWVLINPQAHQSKGIYTHYDTDVQATHSKSGRIPEEMRDLEKKWDWMIRAYVQLAVVGRQESVPVVETELGPVEGDSSYVVLSPEGKTVVLTVRGEPPQKQYVLREGKRVGGTYDILHWVTFSPDGSSLAFAAKSGDKWFMVRDGEALDEGHERVGRPVFNPDGRSLAYAVTDGREHFVLRDGERAGPAGRFWVDDPVFSPDGRSLVYTMLMKSLRECYVVRDGVAVPAPGDRVVSRPVFSPDSRSLAFVVESDFSTTQYTWKATWFLAKDGERVGEAYAFGGSSDSLAIDMYDPVFSPDGTRLASVLPTPSGKESVAIDGVRVSPGYDSVAGIAFGPDGRSLAFLAHEGGRSIVIRDGVQVGTQYGNVILPIHYSPDGQSIAFRAEQGRRAFIVTDGVQVTPDYEQISNIVTTPDGKTMVFAAIRDKVVYRVEVPWAEAQPANGQ